MTDNDANGDKKDPIEETNENSSEVSTKGAKRRRWPYIAAGIIVVAVILTLFLPGPLLRYGIKSGLEELGFKEVEVSRSDASLSSLLFGVGGVKAVSPDGGVVELTNLSTDFAWRDLLDKQIHLEFIELSGLKLNLERDDEGRILISGLPIPSQGTNRVAPVETTAEEESGWTVSAKRGLITDSLITYRQKDVLIPIEVIKLTTAGIDGARAREHGKFELTGKIDGGPITIAGTMRLNADPLTVDLDIDVADLNLTHLSGFAGMTHDQLQGSLAGKIVLALNLTGDGEYKLDLTGPVDLSNLKVAPGDGATEMAAMNWDGKISLSNPSLVVDGVAKLTGAVIDQAGLSLAIANAAWTGQSKLRLDENTDGPFLHVNGDLSSQQIALKQDGLDATLEQFNWLGDIGVQTPAMNSDGKVNLSKPSLAVDGTMKLAGAAVNQAGLSFAIANAAWTGQTKLHLDENSGVPFLQVNGDLSGAQTMLKQDGLDVSLGQLDWSGDIGLQSPAMTSIALKGKLAATTVSVQEKTASIDFDQDKIDAQLNGQMNGEAGTEVRQLALAYLINGAKTSLNMPSANLALQDWSAKGNTDLQLDGAKMSGAVQSDIVIKTIAVTTAEKDTIAIADTSLRGAYRLAPPTADGNTGLDFKFELAAKNIAMAGRSFGVEQANVAAVSYNGQFKGQMGEAVSGRLEGGLNVDSSEIAMPSAGVKQLTLSKISWIGSNDIGATTAADGKLLLDQLAVLLDQYQVKQEQLVWTGQVELDAAAKYGAQMSAVIAGRKSEVANNAGLRLLRVKNFETGKLSLAKSGAVANPKLQFDDLGVIAHGKDGWLATAKTFAIEAIALSADGAFKAKTVTLDTLVANIVRNSKGIAGTESLKAADDGKPAKKIDKTALPKIDIGEFTIKGASVVNFKDETTEPKVDMALTPLALKVENITTSRPQEQMHIDFATGIGEFTKITLAGTAKPFEQKRDVNLKFNVSELNLPPLSPYAVQHGGVQLKTGHLNLALDGVVKAEAIKAQLNAVLDNVNLEALEPKQIALSKDASIPLETALNLLRDDDGKVRLDIPIEGNLTDPDFKIDAIVNKAIGSAVFGAVKVIFPPALLISALSKGAKGTLGFPPIAFAGGDATISPDQIATLDKLVTFLAERKNIALNMCAVATGEDLKLLAPEKTEKLLKQLATKDAPETDEIKALKAGLLQLARDRSTAVKNYLIASGKVDGKRLFECLPKFDLAGDPAPRVDLSL